MFVCLLLYVMLLLAVCLCLVRLVVLRCVFVFVCCVSFQRWFVVCWFFVFDGCSVCLFVGLLFVFVVVCFLSL